MCGQSSVCGLTSHYSRVVSIPGSKFRTAQEQWHTFRLDLSRRFMRSQTLVPYATLADAKPLGRSSFGRLLARAVLAASFTAIPGARGQTETINVHLELWTGGSLDGLVVDHTDHGIVIMHDNTPYVFAWDELEPGSAVAAKRGLLALRRGDREALTAEDHFQLGCFALAQSGNALAGKEFRQARKLDPTYKEAIREVLEEYRRKKAGEPKTHHALDDVEGNAHTDAGPAPGLIQRLEVELGAGNDGNTGVLNPPEEIRARVLEIYKSFGETVREVISKDIVLVETDHFLIWTDWAKRDRPRLANWTEGMYAALGEQFELPPTEMVFLAKCPVFCFRSKARFLKFARKFDGYAGDNAVGYTRSIKENGHVHIVLLQRGRSEEDFERFAGTLIHEGTHAFLHRRYSARLIPHWVNEGCADLMAERVLDDHCNNAENAALLAKQYVRYDWPIREFLHDVGPIGIHQYPLAYSVVAYLESLGARRFAGFIRGLKEGQPLGVALAKHYDGITLDQLEERWRSAIQATDVKNTSERDHPEW